MTRRTGCELPVRRALLWWLVWFALLCRPLCAETPLDLGYTQMYNLEFDKAHESFRDWMRANPQDPLGPVSDAAAYLFAEFDRLRILQSEFFVQDDHFRERKQLTPSPATAKAFENQLSKAELLARSALQTNPKDTNALFSLVMVNGLRSDYEGFVAKSYLRSLSLAKTARRSAEQLLAIDPNFHDAWLAIGVENYMLSLKPAPIRWLLTLTGNQTDRDEGLARLKLTAEKGHLLKPFARLLQAVAALRDGDKQQAQKILEELHHSYPRNRLYSEELARFN